MFRILIQGWTGRTGKYFLLLLFGWSGLMIASLLWNREITHLNNLEKARLVARSFYEQTLEYREWATRHGGVYVPVTKSVRPNPHLTVPDRDVTTTTGRKLTLMNPAWITREVFDIINAQSPIPYVSHLTSLKYVNPANKPDAWEIKALHAFERGAKEVSSVTTIGGKPYMRIMEPFTTKKPCLKCHARQGYKVGDIRGGISIAVPLRPHLEAEDRETRALLLSHLILWSIGAGGILLFSRSIQRHQRHIEDSESKYRLLFENNPHPMWVYDIETLRFLEVNDAAERFYGYSKDDFLGMTVGDIGSTEGGRKLAGIDKAGVTRHRRKDGSLILSEVTTHPVDFVGRRAELVMANDVTERERLEDQLRQAQKMEAVGLLAGGVAHDFNNVLTAIIGYANLLQMKLQSDETLRSYSESIVTTAQRAAQLTQSLLAFSRKKVINPVPVELNGIIQRVEKLLKRLIREDIELRTRLAGEDTSIMADNVQIEQVLMNLVTNARDAMPSGGTLTISCAVVRIGSGSLPGGDAGSSRPYVRLTVSDTGSGMDERTRERIFEPFFTTKEMGKGTGLGLATVYGIIKQHQGFVDVESAPGAGTSFHLFFPRTGKTERGSESLAAASLRGGHETILVAEDDEMIRNLTRSVLGEFGYSVIEAQDGLEAVRLFDENRDRIGLLLLDVIMPRKNGKAAYDEIRAIRPGVKALFISGYSADMIDKEGILEKGVSFISKPVSPTELLRKVRSVLDA